MYVCMYVQSTVLRSVVSAPAGEESGHRRNLLLQRIFKVIRYFLSLSDIRLYGSVCMLPLTKQSMSYLQYVYIFVFIFKCLCMYVCMYVCMCDSDG